MKNVIALIIVLGLPLVVSPAASSGTQANLKQMAIDLKWASDCRFGGTYERIESLIEKATNKLDRKWQGIWEDAVSNAIWDEDRYYKASGGFNPDPIDCTRKKVEKLITHATAFVKNLKRKTIIYTRRSTLPRFSRKDIEQMAEDLQWARDCRIRGMIERIDSLFARAMNKLNEEGRGVWEDAASTARWNENRYHQPSGSGGNSNGPRYCYEEDVEKIIKTVTATLEKNTRPQKQ